MEIINKAERLTAIRLLRATDMREVHIAGGSLRREDSKDVDIVVAMHEGYNLDQLCTDLNLLDGYRVSDIYKGYEDDDETVDAVIKLTSSNPSCFRHIDILVVCDQYRDIEHYMTYNFPLDIQRIAWNPETDTTTDLYSPATAFVNVNMGFFDTCVRKYMGYYPDKKFIQCGMEYKMAGHAIRKSRSFYR